MKGVDVVVPCYNYGRYLQQCADSVLQETDLDVRILIIDDASSDGSGDEARRLAAADNRIEVVVHARNQGHIATYNEGLEWVEQDYMLLLSADDLLAQGALARAVELMESQPMIAFVFGRPVRFRTDEELALARRGAVQQGSRVLPGWEFVRRICHTPTNPVETAAAVVRTTVQKRAGGYRAELPHAGDLEMWLRCAAQGDVGEIVAVQAFVRLHGANMRDGYSGAEFLRDYRQRRDAFELFFDAVNSPGGDNLRDQALASLARDLLWDASRAVEQGRSCREILQLALEFRPSVRRTRQYRRLALKRLLHAVLDTPRPRHPVREAGGGRAG